MWFNFWSRGLPKKSSFSSAPTIPFNFLRLWPFFYSFFLSFFWVGLPAYLSNHNPFSREHIFVGFNEFPSHVLVHCHPSSPTTGAYSFCKQWDEVLRLCSVMRAHRHGAFCFKSNPRRLGNVQLIPYPRGLQQNKRQGWESNFCPSASTGSQVQLTTPWPLRLT